MQSAPIRFQVIGETSAYGRMTDPASTQYQSTTMPQVLMYTKTHCSYCTRARTLLERKGVDFTEVPVDHDRESERLMVERSRRHTVPQIFIGDRHIGGYTDLAALDSSGDLDTLLGR